MPISREAMNTIEALSAPLERGQRDAFVSTCVQKVESASDLCIVWRRRRSVSFLIRRIYGSAGRSRAASSEPATEPRNRVTTSPLLARRICHRIATGRRSTRRY
jgi:hypothetical protein